MNETTELIMKQFNQKKTHAITHELGGGDEVDATKLKNYLLNGSVTAEKLDPALITSVNNVAVQMELDSRGVNVMKYGAKGDGVTDDSVAVQNAINYAALNGRVVFAPKGVYRVANIVIPSKLTLVGSGIENTVFKLVNGSTHNVFISENFASLTGTNSNAGVTSVHLKDFSILGNQTTGGYGLKKYGYRWILENLKFRDCVGGGIYSEWAVNTGAAADTDFMEDYVQNVRIYACSNYGIRWLGPHDSRFNNILVYGLTGVGVSLEQTASYSAAGCTINNMHVYGASSDGIRIGCSVFSSDLQSESNGGHGVVITGVFVKLNGVVAYLNGGVGIKFLGNDITASGILVNRNGGVGIQIGASGASVGGLILSGKSYDNTIGQVDWTGDGGENVFTLQWWNAPGQSNIANVNGTSVLISNAYTHFNYGGVQAEAGIKSGWHILGPRASDSGSIWDRQNVLFVDSSDMKLKFIDNSSVIKAIQTADVSSTRVASYGEALINNTSVNNIISYAPSSGAYEVRIYARVITAATNLTIQVTYADGSGAQTQTIHALASKAVGSYAFTPLYISVWAGSNIVVKVTAGTANQLHITSSLWSV